MGCGKSKHDVASDSIVLQRKKSTVSSTDGQENVTETVDNKQNDIDTATSKMEEKNNDVKVKDNIEAKVPEVTPLQQDNKVDVAAQVPNEKSQGGKEDEPLKKEVNNDAEENKPENQKEDVSLMEGNVVKEEETKETNEEENVVKEEETKRTIEEENVVKEEETKKTNEEENVVKEEETKEKNEEETKDTNEEKALGKEEETKDGNTEEKQKDLKDDEKVCV
ncbi:hypothetical protein RJT34_32201 [Clitoria ternatea]|uniref:Uncharacterized protein n=1 Tax=Clitoria ternatea TaxID=43366 RepID=A0AAN9I3J3_CLITE